MKSLITLMVTLLALASGAARADISCTYWQSRTDVESVECLTFTNKYSMPVVIAHNSVESGQISLIRFSGNFDTLGVGQSMTVVSRVDFKNGFFTTYRYYAQAPDASEWSSTLAGMCTARDIQSGDTRDFTFDLITGVISMMECNRLDLAFRGQISTSILTAENRSYRPNSGPPPATESAQDAFERRINQHLTRANITIRESGRLVGEKQKRLDELSEAVRKYLDMDVRQIDMNSLPADMPEWFKSLIAEVKKDIESQTAQLKENESKKLAIDEAIQADIKAIFQSEDGVLPEAEVARGVEESLNAFEESVESSDADVYFQVRTSTYLSSLESSYKSQERLEFLRQVYAWQEESKVLLDTFIALQSEDVDAYNAFVQSQNAIKAYVDQTIDSEYYFRDLNLDGDIKGSIELLAQSEPVLAQRLKSSLNALTPAQLAANRGSVESIAPAIDGYLANQGASSQKIFQSILEKSIHVLSAMKDVVTCIARQQAAGILGSFSEMVTRKDFCTGEELDAGSYTMSVIGFVGDAAELSGLPQFQAGGVLLGLGIGLKKLFDAIMPALRKIGGKMEEIRGVFDLILDVASSVKSEGVKDLVSKVTKLLDSAKNIGFKTAEEIKHNKGVIERWKPSFASTKIDDASVVNRELADIGYTKPPYTDSAKVVSFKPQEPTDFVRVHGDTNQGGRWVMNRKDIEGLTPVQIKEKFALPDLPTKVSDVTVPGGTGMRMGPVAPNYGSQGGGIQFEVLERVEYKNARLIGDL
jgi:hypothetical protein